MSDQLLKGVRVLDFTDFLAGPYCGMYMADMGADVIKVENLAAHGNFVRNASPKEKTGRSMYFQNLNRNKRGVALNLKTEAGKELFTSLIKKSDVLLENNRPGVMERLGFGWEAVHEINPSIIMASISGYGQTGTGKRKPGYDLIAQAMGGSMSITGWPGQEPTRAGIALADILAGMNAAIAINASLYKRRETGVGQYIDVALVDSIVSALEDKMMEYLYTGVAPQRTGNEYVTSAPYDSFKAKDKYFVIASGTDKHFIKFSAAIGKPELPENPLYNNTPNRRKNAKSLKKIIEEWASDKTADECIKIIDAAGIPTGPIYDCADIAHDENITKTRQMLVKVPHPTGEGELTVLGNALKMSEYPCEYKKAAPELGENNREIFTELGYSEEQLEKAAEEGAINL